MKTYFTSDTHFGHRNIIPYCERPFASVEEMNEKLIENWNSLVSNEDVIYHLGDFSLGIKQPEAQAILSRLNGHKILVMGNHDSHWTVTKWKDTGFSMVFNRQGTEFAEFDLSHFPYLSTIVDKRDFSKYQKTDNGRVLLHGHVHRGWKIRGRMVNVGVDVWNYSPVGISELRATITGVI